MINIRTINGGSYLKGKVKVPGDKSISHRALIIGSIANFNLNILFPFAMGMLIALVVMPRLINMVYEKFGRVILVFFGGLIFVAGINSFL